MIMRIINTTPRLSLYPYESQTCPVGCEYAVSTIGVLEVISRLIEPWHYHLPLPMDFSSQSVSFTRQRLLFALTLHCIYPRIVVVPDCHVAEAKGPLRFSMLYRSLLKTLKAGTGQCCGIREKE